MRSRSSGVTRVRMVMRSSTSDLRHLMTTEDREAGGESEKRKRSTRILAHDTFWI